MTEQKEKIINAVVKTLVISEDESGQRIDNYLLAKLKGVPKSLIYRIVRKGEVRVNKGRIKPEYKLQTGDVVRVPPVRVAQQNDTHAKTCGDVFGLRAKARAFFVHSRPCTVFSQRADFRALCFAAPPFCASPQDLPMPHISASATRSENRKCSGLFPCFRWRFHRSSWESV